MGRDRGLVASVTPSCALAFLLVTAPARAAVGYREVETADWWRSALAGVLDGMLGRRVCPPSGAAVFGALPEPADADRLHDAVRARSSVRCPDFRTG
jgi:hypothetical protein